MRRLIWITTVCKCVSEFTWCPNLPDSIQMFIAIFMMENHAERKAQSEPSADPEGGG